MSISHKGERIRETTNLTWDKLNFKLAMKLLENRYLEVLNPNNDKEKAVDISELFEDFLKFKSKSISYSAIKKYKQAWNNWIAEDYYSDEMNQLKKDIFERISTSKLHPNTINKSLDLLSAFFSYIKELGYIEESPISKSFKQQFKKDETEQFESGEIENILNEFTPDSEMWKLLKFISLTGLRISEALSLKSNNFFEGYISFSGKGNRKREIPLLPDSELWNLCQELKAKPKAFFWKSHAVPHRRLLKACNKLGIKNKGFHGIRKYFENSMIDAGANIKATADILGHTLAIQEKHYKTKTKVEKLKDAISVVTKYERHTKSTEKNPDDVIN
ncbi:MAG: tyrosine-type recombinase/integrase [Candidatus Kapabacteria bacterium]|nr:tyrosine-type recombinase/integrase [Ignavibacteriota bacterium]MCW5885346.1 tyrosine-type recombinase/integrase [Candidatus Kapabacteria bacterium]